MNISKRLMTVASMITDGNCVADIGTDHGYIPIYLVLERGFRRTIAMDVNDGPLLRANENIKKYNVSDYVETRLSDGLRALKENEAQTIVIAGMGGMLINRIITQDITVAKSADELILSPHSDVALVRTCLRDNGFMIADEEMVCDEGKYYFVLKAVKGNMDFINEFELLYGKFLIHKKSGVFLEYLKDEYNKRECILNKMKHSDNEIRRSEILHEIDVIKEGLKNYESA